MPFVINCRKLLWTLTNVYYLKISITHLVCFSAYLSSFFFSFFLPSSFPALSSIQPPFLHSYLLFILPSSSLPSFLACFLSAFVSFLRSFSLNSTVCLSPPTFVLPSSVSHPFFLYFFIPFSFFPSFFLPSSSIPSVFRSFFLPPRSFPSFSSFLPFFLPFFLSFFFSLVFPGYSFLLYLKSLFLFVQYTSVELKISACASALPYISLFKRQNKEGM